MRLPTGHRVPIRARLAIASTVVFALTLASIGWFLYFQTKQNLDSAIDGSLRVRARTLGRLAGRPADLQRADGFFQLLGATNTIVASSPQYTRSSLLTAAERARASERPLYLRRGEQARLLALPAQRPTNDVLVVGSGLQQREHALEGLARSLVIGGVLALGIAAAAGYWLATRALQPVERMRRRADSISELGTEHRLPLPAPDDEIRRLAVTLNAMLSRLGDASRHERRFIADASHELRTPLARLRSELELARTENAVSALHIAVGSALEETERLCALADDLLTLALLDENTAVDYVEMVDLSALTTISAHDIGPQLAGADRALRVDMGRDLYVKGDATQLRQAIDNLLENALRHGAGTTTVCVQADGADALIIIADEGSGFDPCYVDAAFERFSRAERSRHSTGTGLGLAIAQAIAKKYGGFVRIDNDSDSGATVTLSLPRAQPIPRSNLGDRSVT